MRMKPTHVPWMLAGVVALALVAHTVIPDDENLAPDTGDEIQAEPDLLEGSGPALKTAARPKAEAPAEQAGAGSYLVRGQTLLGWTKPAPRRKVLARAYAGYTSEGSPTAEAELTSDDQGRFAWALTPPARPMRLTFSVVGERAKTNTLALPDAPAPTGVKLYILSRDGRVVGRVVDMEGKPIDGAEVIRGYGEAPLPCADDGTFEIAVPSLGGEARVTARAPGYAQRRVSASLDGPGSSARVEIKLPKEFRIRGTVFDPRGRPIEGAVVKTFMTSYHNKAITDARGAYTLGHLDPGRPKHSLYARHEKYTEARSAVTTSGNEVRVDLTLGAGVRVAGRVTDEQGRPLEGASLYLGFSPSAYNRLDALAKDQGVFVFPVVPFGAQTLVASRPGYAPARRMLQLAEGEDVTDLEIVLPRGRTVAGRVESPDGSPLAGAYLSWTYEGEYLRRREVTGADGAFRTDHLPTTALGVEVYGESIVRLEQGVGDGTAPVEDLVLRVQRAASLAGRVVDARTGEPIPEFRVRLVQADRKPDDVQASGYAATWAREGHRFADTDGYWTTGGEQLKAGAPHGVEISAAGYATATNRRVLAQVAPAKDAVVFELVPGASLVGTILDASTRTPVKDAVVKLYDKRSPIRAHDGDDVHGRKMARTDAKGHFRITDLAQGEVHLDVSHPAYAGVQHGPVAIAAGVEARAGEIALDTGGQLTGKAADDHGKPLVGVRIEAVRRGRTSRTFDTTTDPEGRFRLDVLPPGTYTVRSHALHDASQGFSRSLMYSVTAEVKKGQATTVDLVPSGTATVHAQVKFEGDLPVAMRAHLVSQDKPARPERWAAIENGTFTFRRVAPGRYKIDCTHFEWTRANKGLRQWTGAVTCELGDGESRRVEIEITAK